MKYLVTGGAGFIGSHVAEKLLEQGDEVVILDDFSTGDYRNLKAIEKNSRLEVFRGSILDKELVQRIVGDAHQILHFAAAVGVFNIVNKPLESLQINLHGTENLLEVASENKIPFFLASSSEVYGKNSSGPLNEESDRIIGSPLINRWSYSEAKAIDESLAYFYHLEKGLEVKIVRFFNTVGPRQKGRYGMVVPRFVEAAITGKNLEVYGDGSQSRCFCHIDDAVSATLTILKSNEAIGQVYNVGNNFEISIQDLAEKIIKITNSKSAIQNISYDDAYGSGFEDMQRRIPDTVKLEKLGWKASKFIDQIIQDIEASLRIN